MKICRYLELFIFAFWAVLLNGCAQNTHYSNLTYNKYSVCTLPHNADERWIASDKVDIYNIDAVIKDNQLVVSGNVKNRSNSTIYTGHLDVLIESPEGKITYREIAYYYPEILRGRHMHPRRTLRSTHHAANASFRIVLSDPFPEAGSNIHVVFHDEGTASGETPECLKDLTS